MSHINIFQISAFCTEKQLGEGMIKKRKVAELGWEFRDSSCTPLAAYSLQITLYPSLKKFSLDTYL